MAFLQLVNFDIDTITRENLESFMKEKVSQIEAYNANHLRNHNIENIHECGQEFIIHQGTMFPRQNH